MAQTLKEALNKPFRSLNESPELKLQVTKLGGTLSFKDHILTISYK